MKKFLNEFKDFISKGNVLDLAVGVIVGSAFTSIVTSLTEDVIMPVVGMITGGIDIADLSVSIGTATLKYGSFLQAIINFLIIAFVLFCLVKALNSVRDKAFKKKEAEEAAAPAAPDPQIVLLTEIRDLLEKKK